MIEKPDVRPVPLWLKGMLVFFSVVFLILQGETLLGAGGIMEKYTLVEGFTQFDDLMLADPLTAAGLWDFIFLLVTFLIVVLNGVPRGPRYGITCLGLILLMLVYPGAAALLFLLAYWRRLGQFRP